MGTPEHGHTISFSVRAFAFLLVLLVEQRWHVLANSGQPSVCLRLNGERPEHLAESRLCDEASPLLSLSVLRRPWRTVRSNSRT